MSLLQFGSKSHQGPETLYAVIGSDGSPALSGWPAPGTTGKVPRGGRLVSLEALLDALGPEVWIARREGKNVCLIRQAEHFNQTAALRWAADCVEHAAQTVDDAVPAQAAEAVAACVAFARGYAEKHSYDKATAEQLAQSVQQQLGGNTRSIAGTMVSENLTDSVLGALGGFTARAEETRFDDRAGARTESTLAARHLLEAAGALVGIDPMQAATRASICCRKAATSHKSAATATRVAHEDEATSDLRLGSSLLEAPHEVASTVAMFDALEHGANPEKGWQMLRLAEYLQDSPPSTQTAA
jgi:hypothetical protein